ncbi:MAG TPA: hypothetical protein VKS24_03125 [Bradyrhizobium sp.]|nr:hypothetical protein [Bradyrhizobium sp.]
MSLSYVSNSDVLNFLHAIGADLDLMFQILWRHVLCIEFIRMRFAVDSEASSRGAFGWIADRFSRDARKQKAIAYLRGWEGKFWITMDQNVKELTEKVENALKIEMGGEVEKFKAGGQYDKRLSVDKKSELVARVRKVINAEQLTELANVIDVLATIEQQEQQKTFYILIDRLDENWVDVSLRFKLIRGLVESLKAFREIRNLKILVAIRSDVLERVVQETRDLTFQREKLDDYFVHIKWTKVLLRQLIELRIQGLFRKQYTQGSIGFDHVFPYNVGNLPPFDYMIDRTLMRARETAKVIKRAEVLFSTKRKDSIEQEWQSAYPSIKHLMNLLESKKRSLLTIGELCGSSDIDELAMAIYSADRIGFDPLYEVAKAHCDDGASIAFAKIIVSILYWVGAIGVKLQAGTRYQFSHIDHPLLPVTQIPDGDDLPIRIHPMLYGAFRIQ